MSDNTACMAGAEAVGNEASLRVLETMPGTIVDALHKQVADAVAYTEARAAAGKRMVPMVEAAAKRALERAAWEAAHCMIICRCSADGREVTVNWGERCPGGGAYGCREYDQSGKEQRTYWEPAAKDCR